MHAKLNSLHDEKNKVIKYNSLKSRLVLSILLLALISCSKQEAAAPTIRPALAYKITAGNGADIDVYSGEIRARIEADHAFRVGGKMIKRLVDAGASVKRGQALAQLDPQDVKLTSEAARSQVNAQQTEADFAEAELKRFRDLFSKSFVSQSALDQKINVANAARARLDAQKANANVALNQAVYATLVAEMDGVVTQVMVEAGQVIAAGQAIMKIANPREKELIINIPEAKIGAFRQEIVAKNNAKRPIRVHLWSSPEKFYAATIREIAGAADTVTRTYTARIAITNENEAMALGMSGFAAFEGASTQGAIAVPLSSLYVKGTVTGVWQISTDNKVSLKPITVLQYRETTALIRAATLKVGDSIVAAGVHKLLEGEVVKPIIDKEVKGDGKVAYAIEPAKVDTKIANAWLPWSTTPNRNLK
jgi:membrane fusion protein, multidrug efflux system